MLSALIMGVGATLVLASLTMSGLKRIEPVRIEGLRRRHARPGVLRPFAGAYYHEPRSFALVVDPTLVLTSQDREDVERARAWHTTEIPRVQADDEALFPTQENIAELDTIHLRFQRDLDTTIESAISEILKPMIVSAK